MKYFFTTTNWRTFIFVGSQFCFSWNLDRTSSLLLNFCSLKTIFKSGYGGVDFFFVTNELHKTNVFFFLALVFLAGGLSHIRPQMTQLCSKSCRNLQTTTNVFCPLFSRAGGAAAKLLCHFGLGQCQARN